MREKRFGGIGRGGEWRRSARDSGVEVDDTAGPVTEEENNTNRGPDSMLALTLTPDVTGKYGSNNNS